MFKTLRNAFSLPELRKKILYVIFIIVLYRIGAAIPIPYSNASMMDTIKGLGNGSILQYMSILSGTAFSRATLFALSISPYINASIIIQLLCTAIPALENMAKEEDGRNKITQITRYVTVGLALITAYGYYMMLRNYGLIINKSVFSAIVIIACYTAGSCLIMWLGEKINENGIGNGISIILFVNIVSSIPSVFGMLISYFKNGIGGIITAGVGAFDNFTTATGAITGAAGTIGTNYTDKEGEKGLGEKVDDFFKGKNKGANEGKEVTQDLGTINGTANGIMDIPNDIKNIFR